MTEHPRYDVAIIGYGPVGATAANILGQQGLSVVVLERDPDIYARARAISTDEEVMRIWQKVGLADRLQAEMLPGGDIAFVDAEGRPFTEVKPIPRGCGHPAQQFIYQPAVDMTLRWGVERFDNVEIRTRHESLKVLPGPDDVEILAADLERDEFVRIRASYVIAADGGSSATRGQLGIGYQGTTFSERWIVIDTKVKTDWAGSDRLKFHCDPARPTVDCPTPLGHHRWEYPVRESDDESALTTDEAIWKVLNGQGITTENVEILRAVVYNHHVRVADRWRVGRVFLAGDAAHAMPPWAGQGMASGVRDVDNLGWKLGAVLRGELPESILDTYQAEREPHVRETTDRTIFTGKIITEHRPAIAAMRNHGFRALSKSRAFRTWLIKTQWIPDAHYPKGLLSDAPHRARGRQIPQPLVEDANGRQVRLDEVLDGRWCVLDAGRDDHEQWRSAGATILRVVPAGTTSSADSVVDIDGDLTRWLHAQRARTVVLRPDGFVYAAARPGQPLPPPPHPSATHLTPETRGLNHA